MLLGVSGNIATGKTTLTKIIEEEFGFFRVAENSEGNEFLPEFYMEMERWALASQLSFLVSRSTSLIEAQKVATNIVVDRTVSEDVLVFCEALNSYGILGARELRLVQQTYKIVQSILPSPDIYIYLEDSAENIIARIYRRATHYELGIEREYIEKIGKFYQLWLQQLDPTKVARIKTSEVDFTTGDGRKLIVSKIESLLRPS